MNNPKRHLIDRVLSFRRQRRFPVQYKGIHQQRSSEAIRKGTEFEEFVVQKFDRDYFILIEWRSDKGVDGIFPLMNKFPDLEFYYESQTESMTFSVECKWRETFYHHQIQLDQFQLENYRHYEEVTGHPTFIVIGVGNTPTNPNEIYIIPLREIDDPILHSFNMNVYKREVSNSNFFLHCTAGMLR